MTFIYQGSAVTMHKVRWVLSYAFFSKFHTVSSSAKKIENRLRFDKVTESPKVGTFSEAQCIMSDSWIVAILILSQLPLI